MLKHATTLFLIAAILSVTLTSPVHGQPPVASGPSEPSNTQTATAANSDKAKPDLKKTFEDETKKFNAKSAEFDPVKIEHENNKQQAKKKFWNKTNTIVMVSFAIGIAVLVWFVIKYGKECIETTPRNCNLYSDDNCYCERYAEDDKSRGIRLP